MDLELTNGDLNIEDGDLTLVTGTSAVAQHLALRLRTFKGEWELNREVGVPYLTDVMVKGASEAGITNLLRRVCLDTPGVVEVLSLVPVFDRGQRKLILNDLRVRDEDGNDINFGDAVIA